MRSAAAGALLAFGVLASGPIPLAQAAGSRAWLGIAMGADKVSPGVEVQRVVRGSPAEKAGLRGGDRIVRIDGVRIEVPSDVSRAVGRRAAGEAAAIEALRDGKPLSVTAPLTGAPTLDELVRMEHLGQPLRPFSGVVAVHGVAPTTAAALAGRVAVIEFWATWCGPCRLTAPVLERWHKQLGPQGLTVMGIASERGEVVAAHGARVGTRYGLLADEDGATSRSYGVSNLPTTFVVDRRGVVRDVFVGYDAERFARAEALLRSLLAEPVAPR